VTELVAEANQVDAIAAALAAAPLVAFDLEFLAQDRLVPTLCLVQVAWVHRPLDAPEVVTVALLDPLAVDVRPVVEALAAHACAVVHAGRQDLQLLAARFGVQMPRILDTQVMAAFAGIGDQVGYATLANELLGTQLGKELQWTDWSRRPLTGPQITYAEADVRHLPALYTRLSAQLGPRLAWAQAESAQVADDALAATQVTPEVAWRQLSTRGLDAKAMAALVALAAWRMRVAMELDRPLGQVLNDKVLIDIARQRPTAEDAIKSIKGISPLARKRAEAILETLANAPPVSHVAPLARPPSQRAQRWADLLLAIVQIVAERTGVAPRLLATRADAEELARAVDEQGIDAARSLPAFTTWRRDILGLAWQGWLTGKLALVGDSSTPSGLQLQPVQ
jgi:ribonuclease D